MQLLREGGDRTLHVPRGTLLQQGENVPGTRDKVCRRAPVQNQSLEEHVKWSRDPLKTWLKYLKKGNV